MRLNNYTLGEQTHLSSFISRAFALLAVVLIVGLNGVSAQGTEDFENQTALTASYLDGSFTNATSGVTWTYGHSRNEDTFPIDNKGIMLRRASDSYLEATFADGVGTFSFQYRKAFTGNLERQLELLVNGVAVSTSDAFGVTPAGADATIHDFSYNVNTAGPVVIRIKNVGSTTTNRQTIVDNIEWTAYEGGGTPTVVFPAFTPSTGVYYTPQEVAISTTTEDAVIHYTTDGEVPTAESTVYTGPISVSTTTTIKARAFKDGMDPSMVVTATYTFPTEVATIGELKTGAPGLYKLTGEAVLTLQTSTRNAKYIQDATGGIVIDDATGVITTEYNLGDGITGVVGTTSFYGGMLQLLPSINTTEASSTGNIITPVEVALDALADYEAQLVKVNGVIISDIDGGTGLFVLARNYNLNGESNPIIRTQYALDYIGEPIPETAQDIVGVVLRFNTTIQLVPRSLAEITTSMGTNLKTPSVNGIYAFDYQVFAEAKAGDLIEIFTVSGQKVISTNAADGLNVLPVSARGLLIVKVADRVEKVIL
jgi:hypothetical protein